MRRANKHVIHMLKICYRETKTFRYVRVIYLMPSSTHELTRTREGPCVVARKNSLYSYIIEVDGKQQWCLANHLCKYNERVNEVVNQNCAIVLDSYCDFDIVSILFNLTINLHVIMLN
jgi:hypothetical protein